MTNIMTKVARLEIKSETQAQKTRPHALPMLTTPTMRPATTTVAAVSS